MGADGMKGESPESSADGGPFVEVVDPQCEDALRAMGEYFAELDRRFRSGFDPGDTLVADADELREPSGVFLLARLARDGTVVGCGGLWQLAPGIGEIKRMWVASEARGKGVGGLLLRSLEDHARRRHFNTVRLDTNGELTTAIAMYRKRGYRKVEAYNDNPFAEHWFEKTLGNL